MRGINNKRGISPVVATSLLIVLGLVLALIIFIWARSFIEEKTSKFDEPIERSCSSQELVFETQAYSCSNSYYLDIANVGNIPIYGLEVRKIGSGSILTIATSGTTIPSGATDTKVSIDSNQLSVGDEILVVPVLLGEEGDNRVSYTCDDAYGQKVTIVQRTSC